MDTWIFFFFLLRVIIHDHFIYFVVLGDAVNIQNTFTLGIILSKSGSCSAWVRAAGKQRR